MTDKEFKNTILQLQPYMQCLAEKLVGDADNAADAVQEAVIDIWKKRTDLDASTHMKAFCGTIVKRRCIDQLRKQRPSVPIDTESLLLIEPSPDDFSEEDIKKSKALKVFGMIQSKDRLEVKKNIEELSKKFEELKANNKKIYAFGAYITNANYKLASIANEVVMIPSASASLDLTGYHYSDMYYKGLLDKLGVNMEVVRIGNYKSYGENYTGNEMTPELRSELTRILENRYGKFIEDISKNIEVTESDLDKMNDILNEIENEVDNLINKGGSLDA